MSGMGTTVGTSMKGTDGVYDSRDALVVEGSTYSGCRSAGQSAIQALWRLVVAKPKPGRISPLTTFALNNYLNALKSGLFSLIVFRHRTNSTVHVKPERNSVKRKQVQCTTTSNQR